MKLGDIVRCTTKPGNLNFYPNMIGVIVHSKEIGCTMSPGKCYSNYVCSIRYPLKNENDGPLDLPIKWMIVDAVPDSCLEVLPAFSGDKFDDKAVVEFVAEKNSKAVKNYLIADTANRFSVNASLFPSNVTARMQDNLEKNIRKLEVALGIKPEIDANHDIDQFKSAVVGTPGYAYTKPKSWSMNELAAFGTTHPAEIWNFIKTKERNDETMVIVPVAKKIVYNYPATTVIWSDGTKTTVKCSKDQEFSEYYGYLAALAKKVYKTNGVIDRMIRDKREYGKQHEVRLHTKTVMVDMMNGESSNGPAVINYSCADAYRTYSGSMVSDDRPVDPDGEIDIRKNNNVPNEE